MTGSRMRLLAVLLLSESSCGARRNGARPTGRSPRDPEEFRPSLAELALNVRAGAEARRGRLSGPVRKMAACPVRAYAQQVNFKEKPPRG